MTFIVALLTGLGVGSGGLYIFYLTLIKGVEQSSAQGMNLLFFITASLSAAIVSLVKKRISFTSLLILAPFGIAGAWLGCDLAKSLDSKLLSVLFGILIFTVGLIGFISFAKKKGR